MLRRHQRGTGGGPASDVVLTDLDERVMALIPNIAISGILSIDAKGWILKGTEGRTGGCRWYACRMFALHLPQVTSQGPVPRPIMHWNNEFIFIFLQCIIYLPTLPIHNLYILCGTMNWEVSIQMASLLINSPSLETIQSNLQWHLYLY